MTTSTPTDDKQQIFTRVERRLFEAIERAADLDDRSIAAWMRLAAKEKLRREGLYDGEIDEPHDKYHPETK